MKISICIPCYEMKGLGLFYLKNSLDIINRQTFKDFEVIVSDNSEEEYQIKMQELCSQYCFIKYFKNSNKGLSVNTNNAILKANGEIIKILFQDDFFYNENSLQDISDNFKGQWMLTAHGITSDMSSISREHYPKYTDRVYLGSNTIGGPSVLSIKNDNPLLFDENLTMLMDCDYYRRCYDKFGEPFILNKINVFSTQGSHQVSRNMLSEEVLKEKLYVQNKFNELGVKDE
jgi:glycosyltransferase involved in cell wall biosynthesis